MKALEILKNGVELMKDAIDKNPLCSPELTSEILIYEEAIAELEAPKTCETCIHNGKCDIQSMGKVIQFNNGEQCDCEKYFLPFSCSLHEPKDK